MGRIGKRPRLGSTSRFFAHAVDPPSHLPRYRVWPCVCRGTCHDPSWNNPYRPTGRSLGFAASSVFGSAELAIHHRIFLAGRERRAALASAPREFVASSAFPECRRAPQRRSISSALREAWMAERSCSSGPNIPSSNNWRFARWPALITQSVSSRIWRKWKTSLSVPSFPASGLRALFPGLPSPKQLPQEHRLHGMPQIVVRFLPEPVAFISEDDIPGRHAVFAQTRDHLVALG